MDRRKHISEPVTDIHELVRLNVAAMVRPIMIAIFVDNERTMKKIHELNVTLQNQESKKYIDTVQNIVIIATLVISLIGLNSCI